MGVSSERAVSIPQITYDHIDDPGEKKDAPFFQEEPTGPVEGNTRTRRSRFLNVTYSVQTGIKDQGDRVKNISKHL